MTVIDNVVCARPDLKMGGRKRGELEYPPSVEDKKGRVKEREGTTWPSARVQGGDETRRGFQGAWQSAWRAGLPGGLPLALGLSEALREAQLRSAA